LRTRRKALAGWSPKGKHIDNEYFTIKLVKLSLIPMLVYNVEVVRDVASSEACT
jgi:hypothetical protein